LIDAAHALGYRVITTGNRPNDLGHPSADAYVAADFSQPDAILDVAVTNDVTAIVAGCNDFAMLSTAYVCDKLGLPGHDSYETSVRIHHKDLFRRLLEDLQLDTPRSGVVVDASEALELCAGLGYPVIVKPVDLTGGKGIGVCDDPAQLAAAVDHALALSRQDYVVVEQFMVGTHHGFTCFIHDRRVGFWFADDEQYFLNRFLVSGTTTPTSMPPWAIDDLIAAVESIAAALDLVDGLMHVQCVMTEAGPRIIELCRRCPGDLYPTFVRLSTGYDYAAAVVRSEVGRGPSLAISAPRQHTVIPQRNVTRHCLMANRDGVLRSISFDAEVTSHLSDQMLWWTAGQLVDQHLTQKFGIIFLTFDDGEDMRRMTHELGTRVAIDIT
jgi:biotin carboxylase